MYSAIKDIIVSAIFLTTLGTGSFVFLPKAYQEIRSMTQQRVSRGLSSTTKFTEALIGQKKKGKR